MVAVRQDCPESVKLLLERGADVEIPDEMSDRRTCLHQAASAGSAQYIHTLAQSGADVNCRDENDSTPLTLPSEEGHLDVVQLLLQPGADVDAVVSDGSSTLFYASLEEKVEIVELLIAHGAEVNEEGQTAPHWSAQNGHIKVAKALLTHAADLEPVDSDKALPLPWAGAEGHKDMEFFVSAESAK